MKWHGLEWHNLKENPNDVPKRGMWFICKIRGSDNLKLIVGFEDVTANSFDAWAWVDCPY